MPIFKSGMKKDFKSNFKKSKKICLVIDGLSCILVDPKTNNGLTRENIRLSLEAENIEARPLWKPMHLQPIFKQKSYFGGQTATYLFDIGLCLPSGSNLTENNFDRIFEALDRCVTSFLD